MDGSVEDQVNLLQQPLAMGYILSTAPTGKLPKWFDSAAPQTENMCPAVLKVPSSSHLLMYTRTHCFSNLKLDII